MLMGEYAHAMDAKGRIILPAKFREELGESFVLTKGLDRCLFVYGCEEWKTLEDKLKKLPLARLEARAFVRFFFAGATQADCDKQGRFLIPANLRAYAALEKDAVLIGVSNRVEVWSSAAWESYNEEIGPSVEKFAEAFADLGI